MNKIDPPNATDILALRNMSRNKRLASFPALRTNRQAMRLGYASYLAAEGNAFNIPPVNIPPKLGAQLIVHYDTEPEGLEFIGKLRADWKPANCPMCGSFGCGTLDHILPKENYPAFACFSKNLVPACGCNTTRGTTLMGAQPGERVLHPYFDQCLADRLIAAHFEDLCAVPRIQVQILVPDTHPDYSAIVFHYDSIIKPTAILGFFSLSWSRLYRKPSLAIRDLRDNPATIGDLEHILTRERDTLDEEHSSKNNWASMFVNGLLDAPVLHWLFERLTAPGRAPNARLGP